MKTDPHEKGQWAAFFATTLAVAWVLNVCWFCLFTFASGYLTHELGCTNAGWTATTLWFLGGSLVSVFLCVELSRSIGRRRTVGAALVFGALGYGILYISADLRVIRLAFALMGFVPAVCMIVWISMVADFGGSRPGRAIALYHLVNTLVATLSLAVTGELVERFSYMQLFGLTSISCGIGALVFWMSSGRMRIENGKTIVSPFRLPKGAWQVLLSWPVAMLILAGLCVEPFLHLCVNQLFPVLGREVYTMSEQEIGRVVAWARLPSLLSLFVVAHFVDRMNAQRLFGAGMMFVGATVVAMGYCGNRGLLWGDYAGYYLGYGVIWAANLAALNRVVPPAYREIAFALGYLGVTLSVFGVGAVHTALLSAGWSLPALFVLCGGIGAAGGLVLIVSSAIVGIGKQVDNEH